MPSDTKLQDITKILAPFLTTKPSSEPSYTALSPKPSPISISCSSPGPLDQPTSSLPAAAPRPPPPSYEESLLHSSQALLADSFQQRSISFDDLLGSDSFQYPAARWTSDTALTTGGWLGAMDPGPLELCSPASAPCLRTSGPGQPTGWQPDPDRDLFTPPLPWRQASLPQPVYTELPADLAELISDNGFGAGEVPRSNSVPADMSYSQKQGFPGDFLNTTQ
jgi:hypothetical protein